MNICLYVAIHSFVAMDENFIRCPPVHIITYITRIPTSVKFKLLDIMVCSHHFMEMIMDFNAPDAACGRSCPLSLVNEMPPVICGSILTHWGRVTHICVSKLVIIASDNGLSPDRRQAIIWTSAGILLIGPLGTNFREILIEIITFSFKKMRLKVSSVKWGPCCHGLNVLKVWFSNSSQRT